MPTSDFSTSAREIHTQIMSTGLQIFDMRTEASLERRLASVPDSNGVSSAKSSAPDVQMVEDSSQFVRDVPTSPSAPSPIRYFLDGSQRTLPGYHCGATPILGAVVTAGILDRPLQGKPSLMAGTLRTRSFWMAPKNSGLADVDQFISMATETGIEVIDPLAELDPEQYESALDAYDTIEQQSYRCVMNARGDLEAAILGDWASINGHSGDWIVVDGALKQHTPNAIGIVKSFTRSYLTRSQSAQLFSLQSGQRTSAFSVESRKRGEHFCAWYLRLHDITGRDPRHALIRVETDSTVNSTQRIDDISAWILAERSPRASADPRWTTLLYPIHYLEQILKKNIDSQTRMWPAART